ncbi:hypothetical protein [Acidimangrovimonas sediminis]|uniref:hypothetical protein n=1 Tax=Acidimangrovimonas sediminis TaxID=2056283 RepID=UPI0011AEE7A4|nr:hypothetical protein [Acidimangrovimonas sediminis]
MIDDNRDHLRAISDALGSLGSASLSFLYNSDHPSPSVLAGARLIFCDLHLNADTITSDGKAECGNIASMLATGLTEDHGPYLLVIWSQFPDKVASLSDYLAELAPGQKPFQYICLDKNKFIDVSAGSALRGTDLPGEIQGIVSNQPGLTAMLSWEQVVSLSAAQTTNSLWTLSLAASRRQPDKALCQTLGKLAVGAAGLAFSTNFPGHSVVEALVPLLADQIETRDIDESIWKAAVDVQNRSSGAASEALYTALHIEAPTSYAAKKRGTVSPLDELIADTHFKSVFGFEKSDLLMDSGYNEKDDENSTKSSVAWKAFGEAVEHSKWFLVQINAACDEAQDHPGLLPFCLAFTVPASTTRRGKPKGSVEVTKTILLDGTKAYMYLLGRFVIGLPNSEAEKLKPSFRIRAALLDKLVFGLRTNSARLGITEP